MTTYRFTGDYPAHVQMPDGSVQLMEPGDTVDLPADADPSPALHAVDPATAPAAAVDEPADVKAWLAEHPDAATPTK